MKSTSQPSFLKRLFSSGTGFVLAALILAALVPEEVHAKKIRAASGSASPSVQLDPFLEPSLNAIAEPLNKSPKMPRVEVEKLRSDFAADQVKAGTPHQRQMYQNAMAVCDALTNGMDQRAADVAAAQASAKAPNSSGGGSIVKSSPIRGRDAGRDAEAIRRKQKDERNYADNEARGNSSFVESGAYIVWVEKATRIRQGVMALYTQQKQLEAYLQKEQAEQGKGAESAEEKTSPPARVAKAPQVTENSMPPASSKRTAESSYVGQWNKPGNFSATIREDHTVSKGTGNGKDMNGTWSLDGNGGFELKWSDGHPVKATLTADGRTLDFGFTQWTRAEAPAEKTADAPEKKAVSSGADSGKQTSVYSGAWTFADGTGNFIVKDDHSVVDIKKNGKEAKRGTWTVEQDGDFRVDWQDQAFWQAKLTADGRSLHCTSATHGHPNWVRQKP